MKNITFRPLTPRDFHHILHGDRGDPCYHFRSKLILSPVQVTQFTRFSFSLQFSLNCNDTVPTLTVVYSIKGRGVSATVQHSSTIDSDANSTRVCCGVKLVNSVH